MAQYGQPIHISPNDQTHMVILNQVQPQVVAHAIPHEFGTKPLSMTCQFCKQPITSNVKETFNWCSCLLCFWSGLLIWICIQCCRDKELNCCDAKHTCPNCGNILGFYKSC